MTVAECGGGVSRNKMQCQRAQLRVVIPPGSRNTSESFVRQYAAFKPPSIPTRRLGIRPCVSSGTSSERADEVSD